MRGIIACLLVIGCASVAVHAAGAPTTLNYQGRLTTPAGAAVADGTYTLDFSVYAQATGGAALWSTSREATVRQGVFSLLLSDVPTTLFDSPDRWLGVAVAGDTEMSPRQQLVSSPYALLSGAVGDNTITSAKIVDGAITNADVSPSAGIAQSKISNATPAINADAVDGKQAADLVQLSPGSAQSGDISITGNGTFGGNVNITGDLSAHGQPVGTQFWYANQSGAATANVNAGWADIPGLSKSFTLLRNSTVRVTFSASHADNGTSGTHHCHHFVIDGVGYGDGTYGSMIDMLSNSGGWWGAIFDEWVIDLNAGPHSVQSQIAAVGGSDAFVMGNAGYEAAILTVTAYPR